MNAWLTLLSSEWTRDGGQKTRILRIGRWGGVALGCDTEEGPFWRGLLARPALQLHKVATRNHPEVRPSDTRTPPRGLPATRDGATMNLLLSDDYLLQDYPEYITNTVRSGHSTCLRFNRKGDHLASGRVDGTVVVWDIDTMGVARKLRGHNRSITSLSWSRCGRYLLSACQGWKAILWDLKDGRRHREVRFRAPVYIADLHPWNQYVLQAQRILASGALLT